MKDHILKGKNDKFNEAYPFCKW